MRTESFAVSAQGSTAETAVDEPDSHGVDQSDDRIYDDRLGPLGHRAKPQHVTVEGIRKRDGAQRDDSDEDETGSSHSRILHSLEH